MEWITQHINVECVLYNIANSFVFIIACVRIVILQHYPAEKEKKLEKKNSNTRIFYIFMCKAEYTLSYSHSHVYRWSSYHMFMYMSYLTSIW